MADVDDSAWDANRAMTECKTAADYNKICAGKKAGDPALRSSHALPHHYLSKAPTPNANGVRAALARFSSTEGLTNASAARTHLEAHMQTINPDQQTANLIIRADGKLIASAPVEEWELRHSGRNDELFTIRGYSAVFGVESHDMGGFRTMIESHALDTVLATSPDVHFVWDHDTRYVGARTSNGTLTLKPDDHGLYIDARIGPYSWAKDLRLALERGDIDQGSIALTVAEDGDEWSEDEDGNLLRTIKQVVGLYDVTVTAQGAFPQTSLEAAVSLMRAAADNGRLPEAGAALVAARGEPLSQKGGEVAEIDPKIEELKHKLAVRKDEIAALFERAGKLK